MTNQRRQLDWIQRGRNRIGHFKKALAGSSESPFRGFPAFYSRITSSETLLKQLLGSPMSSFRWRVRISFCPTRHFAQNRHALSFRRRAFLPLPDEESALSAPTKEIVTSISLVSLDPLQGNGSDQTMCLGLARFHETCTPQACDLTCGQIAGGAMSSPSWPRPRSGIVFSPSSG